MLVPRFVTVHCDVVCRTMTKWGKEEHQGDIKLNLDFVGPPGIKYPQRQPEMDCFDESERLVCAVAC